MLAQQLAERVTSLSRSGNSARPGSRPPAPPQAKSPHGARCLHLTHPRPAQLARRLYTLLATAHGAARRSARCRRRQPVARAMASFSSFGAGQHWPGLALGPAKPWPGESAGYRGSNTGVQAGSGSNTSTWEGSATGAQNRRYCRTDAACCAAAPMALAIARYCRWQGGVPLMFANEHLICPTATIFTK